MLNTLDLYGDKSHPNEQLGDIFHVIFLFCGHFVAILQPSRAAELWHLKQEPRSSL